MKFSVDLDKCQDHGQCVFAAPHFFALDANGTLNLRAEAADGSDEYLSGEIDESDRDAVEEAADMCPVQAILIHD